MKSPVSRFVMTLFAAQVVTGCSQSPIPGGTSALLPDGQTASGGFQTQSIFDRRAEERAAAAKHAAEMARQDALKRQQRIATEVNTLAHQLARCGPGSRLTARYTPDQQVVYLRELAALSQTAPNDVNRFLVSLHRLPNERYWSPGYSLSDNVQVLKKQLVEEKNLKQVLVLLGMQNQIDLRTNYPLDERLNDFKNLGRGSLLGASGWDITTWSDTVRQTIRNTIGVELKTITAPKPPSSTGGGSSGGGSPGGGRTTMPSGGGYGGRSGSTYGGGSGPGPTTKITIY